MNPDSLDQCKKDLLYLVETVEDWEKKTFLYTALISHLTHSPFNHNTDIAIRAYEELTNTVIKITDRNGNIV